MKIIKGKVFLVNEGTLKYRGKSMLLINMFHIAASNHGACSELETCVPCGKAHEILQQVNVYSSKGDVKSNQP